MIRRSNALFAATILAALTLVAAACGGSDGGSANASQPAATTKSTSSATVAVADSDLGRVLVDARGRTLYLFGADMGTKSACSGACAREWPPLLATGSATVGNGATPSLLGAGTRSDGKQQVTYNGHPVYLFVGDQKAGDTNGQGVDAFGGRWYALTATGSQVTGTSVNGNGYGY